MLKNRTKNFLGFLQASGLVFYILFVTRILNSVSTIFQKYQSEIFAPIIMLLLFVMSAVISATLVLGYSGVLFWERKYKESFTLIAWTVFWGLFYFASFVAILYFSN